MRRFHVKLWLIPHFPPPPPPLQPSTPTFTRASHCLGHVGTELLQVWLEAVRGDGSRYDEEEEQGIRRGAGGGRARDLPPWENNRATQQLLGLNLSRQLLGLIPSCPAAKRDQAAADPLAHLFSASR